MFELFTVNIASLLLRASVLVSTSPRWGSCPITATTRRCRRRLFFLTFEGHFRGRHSMVATARHSYLLSLSRITTRRGAPRSSKTGRRAPGVQWQAASELRQL